MTMHVDDMVDALIDHYHLHGTPDRRVEYVNLSILEDVFPILVRPMVEWGVEGYVLVPDGEITASNPAPITLDTRLNAYHARLAYAHEIGHALHGHDGAFRLATMDEWFNDRQERDAWVVAARLLVPIQVVITHEATELIAAVCGVPGWMVDLALGS